MDSCIDARPALGQSFRVLDAPLGLIAGNNAYPQILAREARAAGVKRIAAVAFTGETDPALAALVDEIEWMRVGQLGRMISALKSHGVQQAIMAGQIHPSNLFNLRPDLKALMLLGKLRTKNAETIFGGIADELAKAGITLLQATTHMDKYLAAPGVIAGGKLSRREEEDVRFGFEIAKQVSALDIGQTVIVRGGTVLAVEAFEGTNEAIKRGGTLGRKGAVMVKVSKPRQDLRFDVPVIGTQTLAAAAEARLRVLAIEAGKTLLLDRDALKAEAERQGITIFGHAL
jgi:UDP-2,3-diacylglucosamine hydrolase